MFLTKWSAKLIQEKDTFWAQIVKQLFKPLVKIHSTLNATVPPNYNQAIIKVDSHFWREAIKATTTMNKNRNPESIKTEPIWNNKNIHYKGYTLFCNSWCRAGVEYLQDLWSNGHMMSYEEIRQKVGTSGTLHFTV